MLCCHADRRGHRSRRGRPRGLAALVIFTALSAAPRAEPVTVAVATNFLAPLRTLEAAFEASSGHDVTVVAASTGQLYAQIVHGAPFDVLLAADEERPRLLAEAGRAAAGSQFTYATGRLVLWTRDRELARGLSLETLRAGGFRWLAIANPDVAPYGRAAREALEALGAWDELEPRLVRGQNVGQAFVMAESGNAELGLVALAQAIAHEGPAAYVEVPAGLHEPIRQGAILLERGRDNTAALAFLEFLRGPEAAAVVARYGYSAAQ